MQSMRRKRQACSAVVLKSLQDLWQGGKTLLTDNSQIIIEFSGCPLLPQIICVHDILSIFFIANCHAVVARGLVQCCVEPSGSCS